MIQKLGMVGAKGFEPPLSWSQTTRLSQAGLRPEIKVAKLLLNMGNISNATNTIPYSEATSERDLMINVMRTFVLGCRSRIRTDVSGV